MRIPPYWACETVNSQGAGGKTTSTVAWGWSFTSQAEATEDARTRGQRALERLNAGGRPDDYPYLETPLREEIVDTIDGGSQPVAVITRNRYGSLVLNSASVCFVDVDFPAVRSGGVLDALLMTFSKARRQQRAAAAVEEALRKVHAWAAANPQRCFRLYRTLAGLRLLFTDRLYDPTGAETAGLLQELGSDPLYCRLTEKQESFRARLTPKPWRCGCQRPPSRYPHANAAAQETFNSWLREYQSQSRAYAVCALVESIGSPAGDAQISAVVELHDRHCLGSADLPLA